MKHARTILIIALAALVTILHYGTAREWQHQHVIYRELYFLPVVLAGFWYGLKGGLITSMGILLLYLPVIVLNWEGFSDTDLAKLLQSLLFVGVGSILGWLRDREKRQEQQRREHIAALTGTVAHEINSPLFAALTTAEFLVDDLSEGQTRDDAVTVVRNLKEVKDKVRRISDIKEVTLSDYAGETQIASLEENRQE